LNFELRLYLIQNLKFKIIAYLPLHCNAQLLHHLKRSRAVINILFVYVGVLRKFSFCEVRETGAIHRANSVNAAHIGFEIQELAGIIYVHKITVLLFQPFLFEFNRCFIEVCGYSFYIFLGECRGHFLAAICTAQAIHFLPYLSIYNRRKLIDILRRVLFHAGKEAAEGFFVNGNFSAE